MTRPELAPTPEEIDAAYTEDRIRDALQYDTAGNQISDEEAISNVRSLAAIDPDYFNQASELLESRQLAPGSESEHRLQEALQLPTPNLLDRPYAPAKEIPAPEASLEFDEAMIRVKQLARKAHFQGRTPELAKHRAATIAEAQAIVRSQLAKNPSQAGALQTLISNSLKQRAGYDTDLERLRGNVDEAHAAHVGRGTEPKPLAGTEGLIPVITVPLLSSTQENGQPGWRIRKKRIGIPTRRSAGPGKGSGDLNRFYSAANVAKYEHNQTMNAYHNRPTDVINARIAEESYRKDHKSGDALVAGSLADILVNMPELKEDNTQVEFLEENFPSLQELNARIITNLERLDEDDYAEAWLFGNLNSANNYISQVDTFLAGMDPRNKKYGVLVELRQDMMHTALAARYRYEQRRIERALTDGRGFRGGYESRYDNYYGIRVQNAKETVILYPDSSYSKMSAGGADGSRRSANGKNWHRNSTVETFGQKPNHSYNFDISTAENYENQYNEWRLHQDPHTATLLRSTAQQLRDWNLDLAQNPRQLDYSTGGARLRGNRAAYWAGFLDPKHGPDQFGVVNYDDASFYGQKGSWSLRPDGSMTYYGPTADSVVHYAPDGNRIAA